MKTIIWSMVPNGLAAASTISGTSRRAASYNRILVLGKGIGARLDVLGLGCAFGPDGRRFRHTLGPRCGGLCITHELH